MPHDFSGNILEYIGDGIVSVDANLRVVFVNHAACKMFGFDKATINGSHIDDVCNLSISDEFGNKTFINPFRDVLVKGDECKYNIPMMVEASEGCIYVEDSASPVRNAEGDIVGVVAVFRDVTEGVHLIISAKLANQRYRALFDNTRNGIAVYKTTDGEDFQIIDFNQSAEVIEGVRKDDIIGKLVSKVFVGVSGSKLLDAFRRVWRTGKPERIPCTWYEDVIRKGWRDNYIYKLPTGEIVAVYDDVTDKKVLAEKMSDSIGRLRDNENRFRCMFENSPVPMVFASEPPTLKITLANQSFCDFVGMNQEDIVGKKSVSDLTHPEDIQSSIDAVIQVRNSPLSIKPAVLSKRYICKNGNIKYGLVHLSRVEHGDGRIEHVAMITDVTDQKIEDEVRLKLLATIEDSHNALARANGILSAECDVARQIAEGSEANLDSILTTAGKKLGVRWLCVAVVGETKAVGRWADDGKSSVSSILEDFKFDPKDVVEIRKWINMNETYVGGFDEMPVALAKIAKKTDGHWMAIPIPSDRMRGPVGVVMMVTKNGRKWSKDERDAMSGLATMLCILAKGEKNRNELSRKIEQTILELSKTVTNAGVKNAERK